MVINPNRDPSLDNTERVKDYGPLSYTWNICVTLLPQNSEIYAEEVSERLEGPEMEDDFKKQHFPDMTGIVHSKNEFTGTIVLVSPIQVQIRQNPALKDKTRHKLLLTIKKLFAIDTC